MLQLSVDSKKEKTIFFSAGNVLTFFKMFHLSNELINL